MRYRKQKKFRLSYFVIFTVFFLIMIFIILDAQIRPLIIKISTYESKNIATKIVSECVYSTLSSDDFGYNSLVTVSKNNDGCVSSIESNVIAINKLQATLLNQINTELEDLSKETILISSGTLSGIDFFYEKGPNITFKLEPVGYVDTRLVSKFTPAGVNQTLHQIILEVDTNVCAIIPGFKTDVDVNNTFIIAETVVVGNIPESYTYITGDNRDDLSKIIDYKN